MAIFNSQIKLPEGKFLFDAYWNGCSLFLSLPEMEHPLGEINNESEGVNLGSPPLSGDFFCFLIQWMIYPCIPSGNLT